MAPKNEVHIFLLKNAFHRRSILYRVLILSVLFVAIFLMATFELLPFNPGYLLHCSLGFYSISITFLILVYRAHTHRFSLLKIEDQALYLPRWMNPEKHKIIPLKNIYSIQLRKKNKDGFIMIGLKKGLNRMLATSQFEVEAHIPKFLNLIKESISYYEGGTRKLDIREKVGKSYEEIIPLCSISISVLLIVFYILQQTLIENSNLVFELLRLGGLSKYSVLSGEHFRLTTSLFLHLNSFHLLVNIFTLMVFGNLIEHIILKANLMTIFLMSGLFSSILSIVSGQYVVTIGASGGIYGLIGAYIFIRIKYRELLPSPVQLQQGWILFLIFSTNMFYSLFDSNIDFFCHLGGLITGFIYMAALSHYQIHRISKLGDRNIIIRSLLLMVTIFYLYNFVSLYNFIQVYRNPREYEDHFILSALDEGFTRPSDQVINFVSYFIANQKRASENDLNRVKAKMELIVKKRPENHQCMDTLALIYFRLGFLDKAVEMQKQAVSLSKNEEYMTQLHKFERYRADKK